jgi:16S rRNA G966 N2-methylase RsmD
MRLAAQAKMGYYPTPSTVVSLISNILVKQSPGKIRIIDPCAGQGTALKELGERLKAETYGIELDRERGKIAKEILTKCLITDYEKTRISHQGFSLVYLNPPYDWTIKKDEVTGSERYEKTFLRNTIKYLVPQGVLVFLIPERRLDKAIGKILSYRFKDIRVFRFPDDEYKRFKQIVVFGVLKKIPKIDDGTLSYLTNVGKGLAVIPPIEKTTCHYNVPAGGKVKKFIFKTTLIDLEDLEREIADHGLKEKITTLVTPVSLTERIKPIMPLRHGHLAQLLACGMMNGVVFDRDNKNPLLVKGMTKKIVETFIEHENGKEKTIERDKILITINAVNRKGEVFTVT